MATSVRTRNTGTGHGIVKAVPETSEADRAVIPGEPETVGDRCGKCRGHGLVRSVGKSAGGHYRTSNGAQAALAGGRAVDCPTCEGTGVEPVAPF